jgi:hypothetical protein
MPLLLPCVWHTLIMIVMNQTQPYFWRKDHGYPSFLMFFFFDWVQCRFNSIFGNLDTLRLHPLPAHRGPSLATIGVIMRACLAETVCAMPTELEHPVCRRCPVYGSMLPQEPWVVPSSLAFFVPRQVRLLGQDGCQWCVAPGSQAADRPIQVHVMGN